MGLCGAPCPPVGWPLHCRGSLPHSIPRRHSRPLVACGGRLRKARAFRPRGSCGVVCGPAPSCCSPRLVPRCLLPTAPSASAPRPEHSALRSPRPADRSPLARPWCAAPGRFFTCRAWLLDGPRAPPSCGWAAVSGRALHPSRCTRHALLVPSHTLPSTRVPLWPTSLGLRASSGARSGAGGPVPTLICLSQPRVRRRVRAYRPLAHRPAGRALRAAGPAVGSRRFSLGGGGRAAGPPRRPCAGLPRVLGQPRCRTSGLRVRNASISAPGPARVAQSPATVGSSAGAPLAGPVCAHWAGCQGSLAAWMPRKACLVTNVRWRPAAPTAHGPRPLWPDTPLRERASISLNEPR